MKPLFPYAKRQNVPIKMPKRKSPLPRPTSPITFRQFTKGLFNRS